MAPLPITALDCDDKTLRALRHAGLKTVGMVAERLHSELSERLGKSFRHPAEDACWARKNSRCSRAAPCPT